VVPVKNHLSPGAYRTVVLGVSRLRKFPYREVCLLHENFPEGWTMGCMGGAVALHVAPKSRLPTGMDQHTANRVIISLTPVAT